MRTLVVSYSLSGNNEALAAALAERLGAGRLRVVEAGPHTNWAVFLDMAFGRTPRVELLGDPVEKPELTVFVAPVWMGQVASPMRACFAQLAPRIGAYAFASISGGALGPNPKLGAELARRLGKAPAAVADMQIVELLPREPKPSSKETGAYRVSEATAKALAERALATFKAAGAL